MTPSATKQAGGPIASLRARCEPSLNALRGSDTAKAAALAGAMIVNNVIALGSTIVFTRQLGNDYGSLAALVSYFLILSVGGQAIQVATAREAALGKLGLGRDLLATLRRWTWSLLWFTLAITVLSILFRAPIAQAVGVKNFQTAAAIGIPSGCLWLELSILRGALQGVGDYKTVGFSLIGEQSARLFSGAVLVVAGLGVTGAYLGTPISFIAMGIYCAYYLRRHARELERELPAAEHPAVPGISLWVHVKRSLAPIAGLIVIAILQNIDLIAAKHRLPSDVETSYAATAVAAKVLVWVAIGAGFYLVPEVSRRQAAGEDTRKVLARALLIIGACSIPVLLIFAFAARPLLKLGFGSKDLHAVNALLLLGIAFTMLACTYLAIQYMLALKKTWFLLALAAVALIEPVLLLQASRNPAGFAAVVLAVQVAGAILAFAFALRSDGKTSPEHAQAQVAVSRQVSEQA